MTPSEAQERGIKVRALEFVDDHGLFVARGLDGRYSYAKGEWYCGPDHIYRSDRFDDEFEAALNDMHAARILAALE